MIVPKQKIQELDGLRGLAIIMVFVYHLLPRSIFIYNNAYMKVISRNLNIGWTGVDLFFVLSGFLITANLLSIKSKDRFFINFYGRRILRIFPLYYITLVFIFVFFSVVDAQGMDKLEEYKLFYYLFAQNWVYALAMAPVPEYLGHFWSLAIEEQFYIIWPILIYRLKNKTFLFINAAIIGLVLLYRLYIFYGSSIDNISVHLYFSTLARIDSIIIGSSIALLFHVAYIRKFVGYIQYLIPVLILIVVMIGFSYKNGFVRDNPLMMTFGFTIIGLIYGCVLILSITLQENSLVRVFLRSDILGFFGKYSYAMYLFHMPVLVVYIYIFKRINGSGFIFWLMFSFFSLATTIVASLISWHVLEKRFLRLKRYFE